MLRNHRRARWELIMEIVHPVIVENQKSYFSQKNIKTCILDSKYTHQNGHKMLILWIDLQGFCYSRLHSTKSHNLRTFFLLFINTWDINDLTFNYWRQLQLLVWHYVCVMDVFVRVALYLTVTHSTPVQIIIDQLGQSDYFDCWLGDSRKYPYHTTDLFCIYWDELTM